MGAWMKSLWIIRGITIPCSTFFHLLYHKTWINFLNTKKTQPKLYLFIVYPRPDSNRHALRHRILSATCLPFHHSGETIYLTSSNKFKKMEAATGIEPVVRVLQTRALPLGYAAVGNQWSGRRDSNPRPRPWQGRILPLNYFRKSNWGSWIRTNEWRSQSPMPYRLAIPQ